MKYILITLLFSILCFNCKITSAQEIENKQYKLQGEIELTIDVSNMKNTHGRFMIMVGGELFYPKVENNLLKINKLMQEPRRAFLAFFPEEKIKANPGKKLNEISAEVSDNLNFLGVPGKYKIIVNGTLANAQILNPSPDQKKYAALLNLKTNYDTKVATEHLELVTEIKNQNDNHLKDSLIAVYYKFYREQYPKYYQDTIIGFIKHNPDAPASLFELEEYSYEKTKDLKTLSFLYNALSDRLKALPTAKRIYNVIDGESFATNNLIGKHALYFTQNDPSGRAISLTDFKGNITLLEFWASWCGPCRASNPALVQTYQKYHSKGFRILGVSLDENKEHWVKAIKDDGLVWMQVSDLKGFGNAVADLYHVNGIPSNFLIDEFGKILASNLDNKELHEYLEKLIK